MSGAAPWWVGGDQRCEHCLQLYVTEMELRCTVCDAPICPHCVVRIRERVLTLCPDCEA